MDEQKLGNLKHDFGLLIEAGFIAVKQLDEISSRRLFQAAQRLKPESTAPKIGLGYIALNKLEVKEASEIFQTVVEQEPDNWLAQTFLGMCYLLQKPKRTQGEKLIHEAMKKTSDPTVKNLGEIALEWSDKDLKKREGTTPFFSGSKEQEKAKES